LLRELVPEFARRAGRPSGSGRPGRRRGALAGRAAGGKHVDGEPVVGGERGGFGMDRRLGPRARSSVSQASTTGARCSISRGWLPIRRGTAGGLAGPSSPFSGPARARRRSTSTSLRRHATARTVVDPSMPPAPGAWAGHPPHCLLGRRQPEGDHHPDGEDDNSPEERHIRSYADLHARSYADMLFAAHLLRPLRTLDPAAALVDLATTPPTPRPTSHYQPQARES